MRTPFASDLLLLARALMLHPVTNQPSEAERIVCETTQAHRHFAETGRSHGRFGDGSLMARIMPLAPAAEPLASDIDFLVSVRIAASVLESHYQMRLPSSQLCGRKPGTIW